MSDFDRDEYTEAIDAARKWLDSNEPARDIYVDLGRGISAVSDLLDVVDELRANRYTAREVARLQDEWYAKGYNAAIEAAFKIADDEAEAMVKECAAQTPGTPEHDELSLMADTAIIIRTRIAALRKEAEG